MIKTTLGTTLPAVLALKKLLKLDATVKVHYAVDRLYRQVLPEAEAYEQQKLASAKAIGRKVQRGDDEAWEIPPAQREAFAAKVAEIDAIPCELSYGPLKLSLFGELKLSGEAFHDLFEYLENDL
jgi:hypothetical protein